ncbi:MAG: DUF86 domain-containing protein [Acidimicrobiia bacterium]|nr:DUF86 domain-containing protein [Acidimicrobiia bacterium]
MGKDPRPRLDDILRSIEWIEQDIKGKSFAAFTRDRRLRQLVERNIEIVSEASRHIPEKLKAAHPAIPWRDIAGIGNVLRHEYGGTDPSILWDAARADLKPLKAAVERMLRALDREKE